MRVEYRVSIFPIHVGWPLSSTRARTLLADIHAKRLNYACSNCRMVGIRIRDVERARKYVILRVLRRLKRARRHVRIRRTYCAREEAQLFPYISITTRVSFSNRGRVRCFVRPRNERHRVFLSSVEKLYVQFPRTACTGTLICSSSSFRAILFAHASPIVYFPSFITASLQASSTRTKRYNCRRSAVVPTSA